MSSRPKPQPGAPVLDATTVYDKDGNKIKAPSRPDAVKVGVRASKPRPEGLVIRKGGSAGG